MCDYDNAIFRLATETEPEPEDYTGEDIPAHFLDKPFKAVRVFLLQLRIFAFSEENILVFAIGKPMKGVRTKTWTKLRWRYPHV